MAYIDIRIRQQAYTAAIVSSRAYVASCHLVNYTGYVVYIGTFAYLVFTSFNSNLAY